MPGKRRAATLLVANRRTREALPAGFATEVVELVENGVDLSLWQAPDTPAERAADATTTFVYMGRLVDWKAVDLVAAGLRAGAHEGADAPLDPRRRQRARPGSRRSPLRSACRTTRCCRAPSISPAGCRRRSARPDCTRPMRWSCRACSSAAARSCSRRCRLAKPVIATAWGGPLDYLDAELRPAGRAAITRGHRRRLRRSDVRAGRLARRCAGASARVALRGCGASSIGKSRSIACSISMPTQCGDRAARRHRAPTPLALPDIDPQGTHQ